MANRDAGYADALGDGKSELMIAIEICYALPSTQTLLSIEVESGATIRQAIERSGIVGIHPEIDLSTFSVGVFGKIAALDTPVCAGDRVEIYRTLIVDPKLARQRRVEKSRSGSVEGRRWVAKERRR
jgi:hypothetical protein